MKVTDVVNFTDIKVLIELDVPQDKMSIDDLLHLADYFQLKADIYKTKYEKIKDCNFNDTTFTIHAPELIT